MHGDYNLEQVLFTGKDFYILDVEGDPERRFSIRRIKRSAMRDLASMIRSFNYVAYRSLYPDNQIREEDIEKLLPFVEQWHNYTSGFFYESLFGYRKKCRFCTERQRRIRHFNAVFLLEKALNELVYELNNRPDWIIIPLKGIKQLIKNNIEKV